MRDPDVCMLCGVEIKDCPMRTPEYCGLASRYVRLRDWLILYSKERLRFAGEMARKRGIPDLSRLKSIEAEIDKMISDWDLDEWSVPDIDEKENP